MRRRIAARLAMWAALALAGWALFAAICLALIWAATKAVG